MKKVLVMVLIFLLPLSFVVAETITDNFDDNSIDSLIWVTDLNTGNMYLNETNQRLEFEGNTTGSCSSGYVHAVTKEFLNSSLSGTVKINVEAVIKPTSANDRYFFAISNHGGGSFTSTPPAYCGVYIQIRGDNFRVGKNFPTAGLVSTIQATDSDEHALKVVVDRLTSTTQYRVYFDNVLKATVSQDTGCSNPTLNVSVSGCSTDNKYKLVVFDDFEFETRLNINGTGAGCNDDADCESGKCDYGFCVLKVTNEPCTENSQCLSGVCTNNKCSKVGLWEGIDASKDQMFGDSTNTNNFLALFIMGVGVLFLVAKAGVPGLMLGAVWFYAFGIFFTIVGWLSPFITVICIIGGVVVAVIGLILFGQRG